MHESDNPHNALTILSGCIVAADEDDTWYDCYASLALEAFLHEAATGSIKAIEWFLICFKQKYLPDSHDQYLILVDIGFTFYNFTRDIKYRYAALNKKLTIRFRALLQTYKAFVKSLPKSNATRFLLLLKDLIYVGFVTSVHLICCTQDDYEEFRLSIDDYNKALKVLSDAMWYDKYYQNEAQPLPPILCGLAAYHAAKLYDMTHYGSWRLAPIQLYANAITKLRAYASKSESSASYFYDAIGGKNFFV